MYKCTNRRSRAGPARQPHLTLAGLHADVSENRFPLENEASARLKITFADMTYPGQRPQYPSLSPHFLLILCILMAGDFVIFQS